PVTKTPLGAGFFRLARPERFELPTAKCVAWCSIQLSYGRKNYSHIHSFSAFSTGGSESRSAHPCALAILAPRCGFLGSAIPASPVRATAEVRWTSGLLSPN